MFVKHYCLSKEKICSHATEFGYCSITGCVQSVNSDTSESANSSTVIQQLPDELVINGVKYIKAIDSE